MVACSDCQCLLKRIQEVEFTALELNLYLNTHPDDVNALEQFSRMHTELCNLKRQYEEQYGLRMHTELCNLKRQYEEQYGPLLNYGFGLNKGNTWLWALQPWPWEM